MKDQLVYRLWMFAFILVGCETVVDIELPDRESALTVNAFISPDEPIHASVHASKGVLEAGELEIVDNATLTLSGSDGTTETVNEITFSNEKLALFYVFNTVPKAGVVYTLKATAAGYADVEGKSYIPEATEILSVDTASIINKGFREGQISVTFNDDGAADNAYEFKFYALIYSIDTTGGQFRYIPVVQELYAYFSSADDLFGGEDNQLLLTDELFNGNTHTKRINYDYQIPFIPADSVAGDSIDIRDFFSTYLITELRSLSTDYYLFQSSFTRYQFSAGDPFAQPAQVYNNIDNGYGIFGGYNTRFDTLQVSQGILPSPLDD